MPPEDQKLFITGRAAHEANIYVARQILKKLESKIAAWEKIIESMPKEEGMKAWGISSNRTAMIDIFWKAKREDRPG